MKNYKIPTKYIFLTLFVIIVIASIFNISDKNNTIYTPQKTVKPKNNNASQKKPAEKQQRDDAIKKKKSSIDPEVLKIRLNMAIEGIKEYNFVRDAAIMQEGNTFSLAIIVDYAINKEYAKNLGDNFVRSVKGLSDDISPGKEIGSGKYNYLIGIYFPDKTEILSGAKASSSTKISW